MASSVIAWAINRFAPPILAGVDASCFELGFGSGNYVIKNLAVKPNLIENLFLGSVRVQIPYVGLFKTNDPVKVNVEQLLIVLHARGNENINPVDRLQRLMDTKKLALLVMNTLGMDNVNIEAIQQQQINANANAEPGFVAKTIAKIVDNIHVHVSKVHIRYEDEVSYTDKDGKASPMAFGATIDTLDVFPCDAEGAKRPVTEYSEISRRLVDIGNFAIYSNARADNVAPPQNRAALIALIPSEHNKTELATFHHYLLKPTRIQVLLSLRRARPAAPGPKPAEGSTSESNSSSSSNAPPANAEVNQPNTSVRVIMGELDLDLAQSIYNGALGIVTHLTAYQNKMVVLSGSYDDPSAGAIIERTPKAMWQFAIGAIARKARHERRIWQWDFYLERQRLRTEYVNLWRRRYYGAPLTKDDQNRLAKLDHDISYNDVVIYRKLAAASVQRDIKEKKVAALSFLDKLGFGGRSALLGVAMLLVYLILSIFLGRPIALGLMAVVAGALYWKGAMVWAFLDKEIKIEPFVGTNDSWKELYRLIAYDPEYAPKPTAPLDEAQFGADVALKSLKVNFSETAGPVMRLDLSRIGFEMVQRPASLSVGARLHSISVAEHVSFSKSAEPRTILAPVSSDPDSDLWRIRFDQNPLDKPGMDMFVAVKSEPLAITVPMPAIMKIAQFFTPTANAREVRAVARQSAKAALATARAQVKYAILTRKTIQLDIDLNAPRIEVPQRQSDSQPEAASYESLFVNLGRLVVTSHPVRLDPEAAKSSAIMMDSYIYDRYNISLKGAFVRIAPSLAQLVAPPATPQLEPYTPPSGREKPADGDQVDAPNKAQMLIRPFDVLLAAFVCTIPAAELPGIKLDANVTRIKVCASKDKLTSLLTLLNAMLPPPAPATAAVTAPTLLVEEDEEEEEEEEEEAEEEEKENAESPKSLKSPQEPSTADLIASIASGQQGLMLSSTLSDAAVAEAVAPTVKKPKKKRVKRVQTEQDEALARENDATIPHMALMRAALKLDSVCVVLLGRDLKREDSSKLRNIVQFEMRNAKLAMNQSNKDLAVQVDMQDLFVKDSRVSTRMKRRESRRTMSLKDLAAASAELSGTAAVDASAEASTSAEAPTALEAALLQSSSEREMNPALYLVHSPPGEELISLKYHMVAKTSSAYEFVQNDVEFDVGSLGFNLNRSALSYIMMQVNDMVAAINEVTARKSQPEGQPVPAPETAPAAAPVPPVSTVVPRDLMANATVSIKELHVALIRSETVFSSFSLPESKIAFKMRTDGAMSVEGSLGALVIRDAPALNPDGTHNNTTSWPVILSVPGCDKAVSFRYQMFKPCDKAGLDMAVELKMNTMEYVYVQKWVLGVSAYFIGMGSMFAAKPHVSEVAKTPVKTPKKKHSHKKVHDKDKKEKGKKKKSTSASSTSSKKDKTRSRSHRKSMKLEVEEKPAEPILAQVTTDEVAAPAEEAEVVVNQEPWIGKALRLKLDVRVESPVILVPRASNNREHLRVELGTITVANEITNNGTLELIDSMKVDVSGMNIKLVGLQEEVAPTSSSQTSTTPRRTQVMLLRETGTDVKVSRLLWRDQSKEQTCPSMDVVINLRPMILDMDKRHLYAIFGMLGGNMKETPSEDKEVKRYIKDFDVPAPVVAPSAPETPEAEPTQKPDSGFEVMRVHVAITRFELNFNVASSMSFEDSVSVSPSIQLALNDLETDFKQSSDKSMSVRVLLESIIFSDRAAPKEAFNELVTKVKGPSGSKKLFTVGYSMSASGETDLDIDWSNLVMILLPQTIVRAKNDFMESILDALKLMQPPVASHSAKSVQKIEQAPPQVAEPVAAKPPARFSLKLALNSPCIVLLKSSDFAKSDSLFLDMGETLVAFETMPETRPDHDAPITVTKISCIVKNFRFHKILSLDTSLTASLDTRQRVDILQPFGLKLMMTMDPLGKEGIPTSVLNVETDDIDVIVSYRDLQLFTEMQTSYQPAINAFAAKPAKAEDEEEESDVPDSPSSSQRKLGSTDDLQSTEAASAAGPVATSAASAPAPSQFKVRALIKSLQFGMINDRFAGGYFVPLLRSSLRHLTVSATTGNGYVTAAVDTSGLSAHSYNRSLAGWEPLIEPWEFAVAFSQMMNSGSTILVTSVKDSVLNMNMTRTMVDSVFGILDIVNPPPKKAAVHGRLRDVRSLKKKRSRINPESMIHPYVLRNNTGVALEYWLASIGSETPLRIAAGQSTPLAMKGASRREIMTENFSHSLQVQLLLPDPQSEGSVQKSTMCHIAIARNGVSLHPIESDADTILVCDVFEHDDGSKEVTFRGDYCIVNASDEPIFILPSADPVLSKAAQSASSATSATAAAVAAVTAKRESAAPIELAPKAKYSADLAGSSYKFIRVKPKGSFEWSDPIDLRSYSTDSQVAMHCRNLMSNAADGVSHGRDWFSFGYVEVHRTLDHTLTIYAPLIVENMMPNPVEFRLSHTKAAGQVSHESTLSETEVQSVNFLHAIDDRITLSLRIPEYDWSEPVSILDEFFNKDSDGLPSASATESKTCKLILLDAKKRPLRINADISRLSTRSGFRIVLYVRYWIANCTGLRLWFKTEPADKHAISGQLLDDSSVASLSDDQQSWYSKEILSPKPASEEASTSSSSSSSSTAASAQPARVYSTSSASYLFYGGSTLSVAVENSNFSKPVKLGASNQGTVQIKDEKSGRRYVFYINVSPASGRFWRSGVVKLIPCFILANFTSKPIEWRQSGSNSVQKLGSGQQMPLHWPSAKHERALEVRFAESKAQTWSAQFLPTAVGRYPIKIRHNPEAKAESPSADSPPYDFMSLHIRDNPGASTFIALQDQPEKSFIQIKNRTDVPLIVRELGDHLDLSDIKVGEKLKKKFSEAFKSGSSSKLPSPKIQVAPHSVISYSWTDPQLPDPELMIYLDSNEKDADTESTLIDLMKIKEFKSIKLGPNNYLRFSMKVRGQAKTLIIRHSRKPRETSLFGGDQPQPAATEGSSSSSSTVIALSPEKFQMRFTLQLKGVGVSIVDDNPQEVMYLSVGDISMKYTLSDQQQSIEAKIGSFQLDNDLYLTPHPVVLSSTPVKDKPFFHVVFVRDPKYTDFFCYRYFAVAMQKLNVEVDEAFLVFALSWSSNIMKHLSDRAQMEVEERLLLGLDVKGPPRISKQELESPDAFYFELFQINSMEIDLTYSPTRNFEVPPAMDSGAADLIVKVGPYLSPVEEAPIKLAGMLLRNAFAGKTEFVQNISGHYTRQFLSQAFKILGSAEWLGNPTSLVSGLGSGVYTFINEPATALVHSPDQFGVSVAKGTKALVQGTVKGALNMAGKLVGNVGKLGAFLTMDDDYRRERDIMKHKKARHVGEGLGYGLKEFGTGLVKGITGVVTQPMKGAKEEGLKGFGKGLGKGLLGVVLKPTVGAVDLATRTVEGIKNTGSDMVIQKRVRLPRYFGEDHILIEYDESKAEGQNLLKTLEDGAFRHQYYVFHYKIGPDVRNCVLFSNNRVFLLEKNKIFGDKLDLASPFDIEWAPRLRELTFGVETDEKKLRVILRPNLDLASLPDPKMEAPLLSMKGSGLSSLLSKKKSEYVIPCTSAEEVLMLAAKASGFIRGTDNSVVATKQIKARRKKAEKQAEKELQGGTSIFGKGMKKSPSGEADDASVIVAANLTGGVPGMGLGAGAMSPRSAHKLSRVESLPPPRESDDESDDSTEAKRKKLAKTMSYTANDAEEKRRRLHEMEGDASPSAKKKKNRHSVTLGSPIVLEPVGSQPDEASSTPVEKIKSPKHSHSKRKSLTLSPEAAAEAASGAEPKSPKSKDKEKRKSLSILPEASDEGHSGEEQKEKESPKSPHKRKSTNLSPEDIAAANAQVTTPEPSPKSGKHKRQKSGDVSSSSSGGGGGDSNLATPTTRGKDTQSTVQRESEIEVQKSGVFGSKWKKRHMVLEVNGTVSIYRDDSKKKLVEKVSATDAILKIEDTDNTFVLTATSAPKLNVHIRTAERDMWVTDIVKAGGKPVQ